MSAATAAAVATVAGVGVSAASAAGAFSPGSPSQPNYGQITRDAQQAQIDLLPAKTAASQQYDPQLAAVQQQINYNNLFGTPGTPQTTTSQVPVQGYRNTLTGEFRAGNTAPQWTATNPSKLGNGTTTSSNPWQAYTQYQTQTVTTPGTATPGTLDMAEQALPRINALSAQGNTATRTANINDLQTLGPQALAALRAANPTQTALTDTLASQAQSELAAGSRLTPSMLEEDQQNVRAAQAARGMGVGPTDAYTEAFTLGQAGQNLLQSRQAFAGNVANQQAQLYTDPFLSVAGVNSSVNPGPGQFAGSSAGSATLNQINPGSSPYSLAQGNANAVNQYGVAGYNSQASGIGQLAGTNWGQLFGSVGNAFGGGGARTAPTYGAGALAY